MKIHFQRTAALFAVTFLIWVMVESSDASSGSHSTSWDNDDDEDNLENETEVSSGNDSATEGSSDSEDIYGQTTQVTPNFSFSQAINPIKDVRFYLFLMKSWFSFTARDSIWVK